MTKKNTKKALLLSVLSLVVCFSMLVGTTFAWFTDSVTSANNVIASGNLDVALEYWDGANWKNAADVEIFDRNANWEPGYAKVAYLKISNAGSLALKYVFSINIVEEIIGTNKDGNDIKLSDYIQFGIIENVTAGKFDGDRAAAIAAVTNPQPLSEALENNHDYASSSGTLEAKAEGATENPNKVIAVVVWMPTDVGNEANHNGTNIPSINLSLNLVATQFTSERDAFDNQYDKEATLPVGGIGSATIKYPNGHVAYSVEVRDKATGAKIGSALIDADSLEAGVTEAVVLMEKGTQDPNLVVEAGLETITYNIEVNGLKANNDVPVKVQFRVPDGLDPKTVKMYHKAELINDTTYNPNTGYITFYTTSFSPFTAVFDEDSVYVPPVTEEPGDNVELPPDLPKATVVNSTEYENVDLPWGSYGAWSPTAGLDSQLEAAYTFSCNETLEEAKANPYANWYCDFYVKLDKDLGENEIFLGGNYGSFGWVGFHNGDLTLAANTEIPLLGSVTSNPWTYLDVVQNVKTFICGVGDVDDALADATFTVMLRLTNPEDDTEYYDVATITHTFTKTVNSGEELQDAINNGNENIELGGDIDLSQGIVIPGN